MTAFPHYAPTLSLIGLFAALGLCLGTSFAVTGVSVESAAVYSVGNGLLVGWFAHRHLL